MPQEPLLVLSTKEMEDRPADHGADDAEDDVDDTALAMGINDLGGNESGDQAEQHPTDDVKHGVILVRRRRLAK